MAALTSMIGGAIQGTVGLVQAGFGLSQYKKGVKAAEALVRPVYEIPPEIAQNLSQAEMAALEGLPAEQKQQFVENIQRGGQQALGSLSDRGLGVAGAGGIFQQQTDAYRDLLAADVGARREAQADVASARLTQAGFKERAFDINVFQPYTQSYLEAQALQGAGLQNIGGGLQTVAKSGETFAGGMGGGGGGGLM